MSTQESREYHFDEQCNDPWLHAEDLPDRPITLKIRRCVVETHRLPGGAEEDCSILDFEKTPKRYILNTTHKWTLNELWGPHGTDYAGHRITLEKEPDPSGKSRSGEKIVITGTPDIDAPVTVRQPLGKTRVIKATKKRERAPQAETPPNVDPATGEVAQETLA